MQGHPFRQFTTASGRDPDHPVAAPFSGCAGTSPRRPARGRPPRVALHGSTNRGPQAGLDGAAKMVRMLPPRRATDGVPVSTSRSNSTERHRFRPLPGSPAPARRNSGPVQMLQKKQLHPVDIEIEPAHHAPPAADPHGLVAAPGPLRAGRTPKRAQRASRRASRSLKTG